MNYKVEHRQSHKILVYFRNNKGLNWTHLKCNTPTHPHTTRGGGGWVQESFYECNCTLDCLNWYSYKYSSFISLICTVCYAHLSWHLIFVLILFFYISVAKHIQWLGLKMILDLWFSVCIQSLILSKRRMTLLILKLLVPTLKYTMK